jgi:3',5'-cyclic AMP phosphodiesterase CpdA
MALRIRSVRRSAFVTAVFLLLAGLSVLAGTTAVSSALSEGIGAPKATTPVTERSAAEHPEVRVAVVGDVGTGEPDAHAVADRVTAVGTADPFDALVLLGDNVYPDGNANRLQDTVFDPYGRVLDSDAALLAVLGNHDAGYAAAQMQALGMPWRWYSHQMGDLLIVALDSTDPENPAQLQWLDETLAAADARWVVAAMHHPPFSAGMHGSDEDTRDSFAPVFERHGVDLVLAGHDHDYQRSVPIGGVTYVVSGAGAKVRPTGSGPFTAQSASVLHFVEVAAWSDRLEVTAIGLDGSFDTVTIVEERPSLPTADSYSSQGNLFTDEDTSLGARLALVGLILWASSTAVSWAAPRVALTRVCTIVAVTSAASVLSIVGGVAAIAAALMV